MTAIIQTRAIKIDEMNDEIVKWNKVYFTEGLKVILCFKIFDQFIYYNPVNNHFITNEEAKELNKRESTEKICGTDYELHPHPLDRLSN